MIVADAIADWLHEKDITHAFAIIGAGNLALWDAITRKGKTEIVCCHHEQACVLAANGYYRSSGRMALALVTTGAGSSNALTGILSSWMDSIPVICISGNESSAALAGSTRVLGVQGYRSHEVADPMVKISGSLLPSQISATKNILNGFLKIALSPRPGPVWWNIPSDCQRMQYEMA